MRNLLFALGVGGLVYGTFRYYMVQKDILANSKISLSDIKVAEKKPDRITLIIFIDVKNDSEFDFILKKYDLAIFINNKKISNVQNSNVNQRLKGNGEVSQISFNVSFNPIEFGLLDILTQVFQTMGKTLIGITGELVVRKGILTIDVPIEINYKLKEFVKI